MIIYKIDKPMGCGFGCRIIDEISKTDVLAYGVEDCKTPTKVEKIPISEIDSVVICGKTFRAE